MSQRLKLILLWIAATLATAAACHALFTAVTLVALTVNGSWSHEYATLWTWCAFILFCLFSYLAIVNIVRLVRYYDGRSHLPAKDEDEVLGK
jgi:membrane protein implicated in regulation of membrane protease activity